MRPMFWGTMSSPKNEPCPCGSGKKAEKCCRRAWLEDASTLSVELRRSLAWHQQDTIWGTELREWVLTAFPQWEAEVQDTFASQAFWPGTEAIFDFAMTYMFWHCQPDGSGKTVAEHYFACHSHLIEERRDWHKAQQASWLGIWQAQKIDPGRGIQMVDILTHEQRYVYERQGSKTWTPDHASLARVVDLGDKLSVLSGAYPRLLSAQEAETARKNYLRFAFPRRRKVVPAQLRHDDAFVVLCYMWTGALAEYYPAYSNPLLPLR